MALKGEEGEPNVAETVATAPSAQEQAEAFISLKTTEEVIRAIAAHAEEMEQAFIPTEAGGERGHVLVSHVISALVRRVDRKQAARAAKSVKEVPGE